MIMNGLKKSKGLSLLLVTAIYILSFYVGIAGFVLLAEAHILIRLLVCDVLATVLVYIAGVILKNSSVYDPYWSVKPIIFCVLLMVHFKNTSAAAFLVLAVVSVWGLRLTYNWITTFENLFWQDWRYVKYKSEHRYLWQVINFFGIHLIPTLVVFAACVPVVYIMQGGYKINAVTVILSLLCVAAVLLQYISDKTMHGFLNNPDSKGKVCREGVWKYSRHPNYLAEISFWWLIYLIALSFSFSHWYLFGGAVLVTLLFEFISVPLMEKRQKQRREEYAVYIRETGRIFPFPKKRSELALDEKADI